MWVFAGALFAQFPVWSAADGAWLALAAGLTQSWLVSGIILLCWASEGWEVKMLSVLWGRAGWHSLSSSWGHKGDVEGNTCFLVVCWSVIVQPFPTFFALSSSVFLLTQIFFFFLSACQLLITPNSGLMTFLCLGIVLYLHHNGALWKACSNVSSGSGVRQFKVPGMGFIRLVPLCCEVWKYWSHWK